MMVAINIIITILAIVYAIQITNESRKYFTALMFILIGVATHVIEAYVSYKGNDCKITERSSLLSSVDNCLNYELPTIIMAQSAILAGFTVIFMGVFLSKTSSDSNPK